MNWVSSWMYTGEIICFSRAVLIVPNPLGIEKFPKKKLIKKLQDQSTIQNSEKKHQMRLQGLVTHISCSFLDTQRDYISQFPLHLMTATGLYSSQGIRNCLSLSGLAHKILSHNALSLSSWLESRGPHMLKMAEPPSIWMPEWWHRRSRPCELFTKPAHLWEHEVNLNYVVSLGFWGLLVQQLY